MENEIKPLSTKELTEVVVRLLEREDRLAAQHGRKRRQRIRKRHKERDATIAHMLQSIEVIKWCILGVVSTMLLALLVLIVVVMQVRAEVERVKIEAEKIMVQVHEIQDEAEKIREKIRHPLEALGGTLGRKLEAEIGSMMGSGDN